MIAKAKKLKKILLKNTEVILWVILFVCMSLAFLYDKTKSTNVKSFSTITAAIVCFFGLWLGHEKDSQKES